MRAVITVPSIENESAGPSYTVPALCKWLTAAGASVCLKVLGKVPKRAEYDFEVESFTHWRIPPLRQLAWSPALFSSFKKDADVADIIHVNGVWQCADIYPTRACRGKKCKVVYCPRGGLSKTALSRWGLHKTLMWHIGGQWRALKGTSMFHAASMKEHDEIRALGLKQPIAIIPNGIDVPKVEHKPFEKTDRKIVFFGRIHETKAADHLVEAWGRIAAEFPEWSVEIAGPDCGAVPMLKRMIDDKNIPRVSFVGEFKGMAKYEFLSKADLYVLPSLTENFGITIAEALACGTPSIASKGCPWEGLETNDCGWWIDIGPDALEMKLKEVLAMPPEVLQEKGARGKTWMLRDYVWEGIGKKMLAAYEWLVNGGEKPEYVKTI